MLFLVIIAILFYHLQLDQIMSFQCGIKKNTGQKVTSISPSSILHELQKVDFVIRSFFLLIYKNIGFEYIVDNSFSTPRCFDSKN